MAEPVEGHVELMDAMSFWWAAIHGYGHPVLDAAVRGQLGRMSHVIGGLTHEPAIRLAEIAPDPLEPVFLVDSGSVAVEVTAKMCLQHWRSLSHLDKYRLLTWRGGYHGDTFQPMSVCDPEGVIHLLWIGVLPRQVFADAAPAGFDAQLDPACTAHLAELIEQHAHEVAAVIVEPVVQNAGGMCFHFQLPAGASRAVRRARGLAGVRRDRRRRRGCLTRPPDVRDMGGPGQTDRDGIAVWAGLRAG